jgi:hypothetical protein
MYGEEKALLSYIRIDQYNDNERDDLIEMIESPESLYVVNLNEEYNTFITKLKYDMGLSGISFDMLDEENGLELFKYIVERMFSEELDEVVVEGIAVSADEVFHEIVFPDKEYTGNGYMYNFIYENGGMFEKIEKTIKTKSLVDITKSDSNNCLYMLPYKWLLFGGNIIPSKLDLIITFKRK